MVEQTIKDRGGDHGSLKFLVSSGGQFSMSPDIFTARIRASLTCLPRSPKGCSSAMRPTTWIMHSFGNWRKIEEPKTVGLNFVPKPLKRLALPRGIEPLFQP